MEENILKKVVWGLQHCIKEFEVSLAHSCNGCPYIGEKCTERLKSDTLGLLKAQEQRIKELEEQLRLLEYGD